MIWTRVLRATRAGLPARVKAWDDNGWELVAPLPNVVPMLDHDDDYGLTGAQRLVAERLAGGREIDLFHSSPGGPLGWEQR